MKKIAVLLLICLIIFQFCCSASTTIDIDCEQMNEVLDNYNDIAAKGGWHNIPEGNNLKRGDFGGRVVFLRNRLILSGDFTQKNNKEWLKFDAGLEKAVKNFQKRCGLSVTGIVDKSTLHALNVPVKERIQQVKSNIERMRLFPDFPGEKYVLVNIPDFRLKVVKNKDTVLDMRVIVGKITSPSPQIKSKIYYLVLNPAWNIPFNTAVSKHLPRINKNPAYFDHKDIRVFKGWGSNKKEYNPDLINWSVLNRSNFNYRLVQQPGPDNPMGKVKFKFPNNYSICLHGTPDKQLFMEKKRAFSSGCIRLEKPVNLAVNLLKNKLEWPADRIYKIIANEKKKTVELDKPLPIFIVYYTAWVSDEGLVNFRYDIYSYDN